jgi:hypothetical protein
VDLIFVTEFERPVNVNSLVYKHFKPILKRTGLPNILASSTLNTRISRPIEKRIGQAKAH